MPYVRANDIEVYYEVQGEGEPLVLIPYLAADQACYAFQVADYAKRFTCYTVDLRGAGLSGKPTLTRSPTPRGSRTPNSSCSRTARTRRSTRTWRSSTRGRLIS